SHPGCTGRLSGDSGRHPTAPARVPRWRRDLCAGHRLERPRRTLPAGGGPRTDVSRSSADEGTGAAADLARRRTRLLADLAEPATSRRDRVLAELAGSDATTVAELVDSALAVALVPCLAS